MAARDGRPEQFVVEFVIDGTIFRSTPTRSRSRAEKLLRRSRQYIDTAEIVELPHAE